MAMPKNQLQLCNWYDKYNSFVKKQIVQRCNRKYRKKFCLLMDQSDCILNASYILEYCNNVVFSKEYKRIENQQSESVFELALEAEEHLIQLKKLILRRRRIHNAEENVSVVNQRRREKGNDT